jgi:hypothetical protein
MLVIVCLTPVINNCVVSSGLFLPKSLTKIGNIGLGGWGMLGAVCGDAELDKDLPISGDTSNLPLDNDWSYPSWWTTPRGALQT